MKKFVKYELTEEEKKAVENCIKTINCNEIDCNDCPFSLDSAYTCILERLREIVEESE